MQAAEGMKSLKRCRVTWYSIAQRFWHLSTRTSLQWQRGDGKDKTFYTNLLTLSLKFDSSLSQMVEELPLIMITEIENTLDLMKADKTNETR